MNSGIALDLLVLIVYVLAVARLTRLINADTVLDPVRLALARAFGHQSTLIYFLGCVWCVGFWLSLVTAVIPVLALSLSWWMLPLIALATSHLVGLLARLDDTDDVAFEEVD